MSQHPFSPGRRWLLAGLAAGVDRNELVKWMTIGVFGLFGVYTVGLALLIEITGIC